MPIGHRTNSGKFKPVAQLAGRQHGVVSRKQLRALGFSEKSIAGAVASGHLYFVFRGVFSVGHRPFDGTARMLAATLACGEGTVVSHRSAAALLRLLDRAPVVIDVIAPKQAGRGIDGVRRHHVPTPIPDEAGYCNSIPCTSPSRTIVDLAGMLGERSLRRVVERAAVFRTLDVPEIERSLAARRRRGAPMLRSILREWHQATPNESALGRISPPVLRSPLEARLLALIAASDLPHPTCNQKVENGSDRIEVDFLWSQQRLVVETDGEHFHDSPLAFERDRKRDRVLQLRGYRVVRFTHAQIEKEPDAVISAIRRLLRADVG